MKKKLIVTLALALCVLICAFSFVGCSKPSGAEEFNAFKQKVVNVLKDNGVNIVEVNQSNESVNTTVSPMAKDISTSSVDQINEIVIGDVEVKSDSKGVEMARQEMYEQSLYIPLIVGDGMVNNHNSNTMYNTSVLVDCSWKTYMEFMQSGTVTTVNSYSPALEDDCAYSAVINLDYTSKDNYKFLMLLVWEDGRMGYRYGNDQKQFVYLDYDPQNNYSEIYCSAKEGEGYISRNAEVVKNCFELISNQFDGMQVNDYKYLTEQKYTIDEQEWISLCAKYFPSEE